MFRSARSRCRLRAAAHSMMLALRVLTLATLGVLILPSRAVAAATCDTVGRPAPSVPTLLAAPSNTSGVAWILNPDCKLDVVEVQPTIAGYSMPNLNCSSKNIGRIESVPTSTQRLFLDHNPVLEADFSNNPELYHLIIAWCNLTTTDKIQFPPAMGILDLDGNRLQGAARGSFPDSVKTLYLSRNWLSSIANFSFPSSMTQLHLFQNNFTSINFVPPEGLDLLVMDDNKGLNAIENVTFPSSLTKFSCKGCGVTTFRGVQLSPNLKTLDFGADATLTDFEIQESDLDRLAAVELFGVVAQKKCRDANATLRKALPTVSVCVISDELFAAKYLGGAWPTTAPTGSPSNSSSTTPTPLASESSSSSTTTIIIVVAVVAVVLIIAGVVFYRRRATMKQPGDPIDNDKYVATADAPGSSAATAPSSGAAGSDAREYLSNDIRNDEAMIAYRIGHDEIQLVRVIGKGGFGIIHLAKFRGRDVAVKQMLPDRAKDVRVVRSFMAEIRLSASLEHPRIVQFIGLTWSTLQDVAVVTEYMTGGDLHAVLQKQQRSYPAQWFEKSADLKPKSLLALDVIVALVYLHSFDQPIIHRDLKTRNVLLDNDGDAKLSDFGASREALIDETMTGEIGTVAWIAPEVLRGERYSEKADIYSLGVLMVELDTARHPYRQQLSPNNSTPPTNTQIALSVSSGKLSPTPSAECPSDVSELIHACVSFDPESRPSAMAIHYEMRKIRRVRTG